MELKVTEDTVEPGAFYGSAIAALIGLLMGLMLHGPWDKRPGGPQIWFSSAAAEALAHPAKTDDDQAAVDAAPQPVEDQQLADLDLDYVPPDPLPVTRLAPDRFPDRVDAQPAAAEDAERQDVDGLMTADAAPPEASPPDLD